MTPEQASEKYAEQWTSGYYNTFADHLKDKETAVTAFLAGHAHAQNRWVKVEDALPEERIDVIVATDKGNVFANRLIHGIWAIHLRNESVITHWQPLPQPPEHG